MSQPNMRILREKLLPNNPKHRRTFVKEQIEMTEEIN